MKRFRLVVTAMLVGVLGFSNIIPVYAGSRRPAANTITSGDYTFTESEIQARVAKSIEHQKNPFGLSTYYYPHDNGEEFYELFKSLRNEMFASTHGSIYGHWLGATVEDTFDNMKPFGTRWVESKVFCTSTGSYSYDEWIALHPDWYLAGIAKYEAEYPEFPVQNGKHGVGVNKTATASAVATPVDLTPTVTTDGKYMWNGVDFSVVFNPTVYSDRYPDLKAAFGYNKELLFKHYIEHGVAEGRVAF